MPINQTFNNVTYPVPIQGDLKWGPPMTRYLVALGSFALSPAGGSYPLTADLNLGSSFGILAKYFTSSGTNPATAGFLRLSNLDTFGWRNFANSGNNLLAVNASDQLTYNGSVVNTLTLPVSVSNGGTGDSSLTAYSVLCGGTTSTNPVQNVSGLGLSGQALTSNGAGTLPTWQNVAGSGTVNTGTAGNFVYYAASTNVVSDSGISRTSPTFTGLMTAATAKLNSGAAIGDQLDITAFGSGGNWGISTFAPNNVQQYFDAHFDGANVIADATSAYRIQKNAAGLNFSADSGLTLGGIVPATQRMSLSPTALTMAVPIAMGSNKIIGLAAASATGDALSQGNPIIATTIAGTTGTFSGIVTIPHTGSDTTPGLAFDNSSNSGFFGSNTAGSIEIVSNGVAVASSNPTISTGFNVHGTNTNDTANSGFVGEYIAASVLMGSPVNSTGSGQYFDITSITLTAGDWDISADWGWIRNGATLNTNPDLECFVGTVAGNNSTGQSIGVNGSEFTQSGAGNMNIIQLSMGLIRASITGSTTYYLKLFSPTYSAGTPQGYGSIRARRVR